MTAPDPTWMTWLDRLGVPLAILVALVATVFFTMRKLWTWFQPHLDRLIEAHVKRQETIAMSMAELTSKTIEIQKSNAETLANINRKVPEVCKWKPSRKN